MVFIILKKILKIVLILFFTERYMLKITIIYLIFIKLQTLKSK